MMRQLPDRSNAPLATLKGHNNELMHLRAPGFRKPSSAGEPYPQLLVQPMGAARREDQQAVSGKLLLPQLPKRH